MNLKEKLYSFLDDFVHNRIDVESFCYLFAETYRLEDDEDCLTSIEQELFARLADMAYGYTPLEEDRLVCPQYYFNDQQIVAKIDEVLQCLGIKKELSTYSPCLSSPNMIQSD